MSASATAFVGLPGLIPRTQFLCNPTLSLFFSAKFSVKPLRASAKLSSRFVSRVAFSSDVDADEKSFSPDLKIFVGNLPFSVDGPQLANLFESAGSVETAEVIYDKETGRSRGFAFVTMSSLKEVEAAVQQFNGYEIDGREIRVNSGPPPPKREISFGREPRGAGGYNSFDRGSRGGEGSFNRGGPRGGGGRSGSPHKLYISNLAWGVDDAALESLFSEQGNVLEAKVIYDHENGRSKGFGFVTYGSASELNSAIESLNGYNMDGRELRVTRADSSPRRTF